MGWGAGQVSMVSKQWFSNGGKCKTGGIWALSGESRGRVGDKGNRVKEPTVCETFLLEVIRNFTFSLSKREIISFMLY